MGFWDTVTNIGKQLGKVALEASVAINPEECFIELKPLGLMGIASLMKARNDIITEIKFGQDTISITIEKFFITHKIKITAALITVQEGQVEVAVELSEGIPSLLQGVGSKIVASLVNLMLGIKGSPGQVGIENNIVGYYLSTSDLGLISRFAMESGIQNFQLAIKPDNYSVYIYYPENMRINPAISEFLTAFLSNDKELTGKGGDESQKVIADNSSVSQQKYSSSQQNTYDSLYSNTSGVGTGYVSPYQVSENKAVTKKEPSLEYFKTYLVGEENYSHEMVLIPAGEFVMGPLPNEEVILETRRRVKITNSFFVGKYPVTQQLWKEVMRSNPSYFRHPHHPVDMVSWFDCVLFCNQLSLIEGREIVYIVNGDDVVCDWDAKGYRLLTEAEWEYCARANQNTFFSGSNNPDVVAWYGQEEGQTHPVGQKQSNGFGLHDMSGNVHEWVWDWYGNYAIYDEVNPRGTPRGIDRISRGGSYYGASNSSRVSNRSYIDPAKQFCDLGFRIGFFF